MLKIIAIENLILSKVQASSFLASSATEIIMTLLSSLISVTLIFLLYKSIKRENIKFLAVCDKSINIGFVELRQIINNHMQKPKCDYSLIEMTISDYTNIQKVCGEEQYSQAVQDMLLKIKLNLPHGIKIAIISSDKIWIYIRHKVKKETLEIMLINLIREINKPIVLIWKLTVEFEVNIAALIYEKSMGDINAVAANLELTTIASKKLGVNNAVIFDRSIASITSDEYMLFIEIQEAIKSNDFRVFYQPIVDTNNLECYAVEAYLRWQHAAKGIISPEVFMPSLEHSGDINWVGLWAFEAIAKQVEYWKINNPDVKIKVNVNWSITQLSSPNLCEKLRKILKKYKVQASDFYFEIPNYKQATAIESASRNINIIRQLGICIAIDNINLQVETIMELDNSEVHMLKFNRDFVRKLQDGSNSSRSIAKMIANNSKAKEILVVGEGVEDELTIEMFKEIGITLAQGYYFSKPKAPTEVMADIMLTPWKSTNVKT